MMIFPQKLSNTWNRHYWLFAVVFLLLVVWGVILPKTMADAPWLDETFTFQFAGLGRLPNISVFETIKLIALYDPHPPLYYITQNIWSDVTGTSLFAINLLPLLYGLLAIAFMYKLGCLIFRTFTGGLLASILLGSSVFVIYYFHETRGYSLFLLVWVMATYFYWSVIQATHQERRWMRRGLLLALVCALYTHYISLVFFGGLFLYHIAVEGNSVTRNPHMTQEQWGAIVRIFINAGLLFTPWFAVLILQIINSTQLTPAAPFINILAVLIKSTSNNLWIVVLPLLLYTLKFIKERSTRFLWIWLTIILIGLFSLNILFDYLYHARHIIPFTIIIILLLTKALLALESVSHVISVAIVSLWVGMGFVYTSTDTYLGFQPYLVPLDTMTNLDYIIESCVHADDAVIMSIVPSESESSLLATFNLYYYYNREYGILHLNSLLQNNISPESIPSTLRPDDDESTLEAILETVNHLYLFQQPTINNQAQLFNFDNTLREASFEQCLLWNQDSLVAWIYTQDDNCDELTSCI
ncbi:MAG: glycosyltransferase family 39 protein [Chloroflexota bacterium]